MRISIPCSLGTMREKLQLDIGFGDVIIPGTQVMSFPVLLSNMESPDLLAYSNESVIAEKFEAMVTLSVINSRMKDFHDIFVMARSFSFDGSTLFEAVFQTFQRRSTHMEAEHILFSTGFCNDSRRTAMWETFLGNLNPDYRPTFQEVMEYLTSFLKPIYDHAVSGDPYFGKWDNESLTWKSTESAIG